jgi:hypothetical protein
MGDNTDPRGPVMQCVSVYERRGQFVIVPEVRTTSGIWTASSPVLTCPTTVEAEGLGAAVRKALAGSTEGAPHPREWKSVQAPLLDAAGVRSWATFVRGTESCSVAVNEDGMTVLPMKNGGSEGGFIPLESQAVRLPSNAADGEIGAGVRAAIRSTRLS